MPEHRFRIGGVGPQGRAVGLVFFVAGFCLLAVAVGVTIKTSLWLGAREQIDGTVVAVERGSHAVVEGQARDGRMVRAVDPASVRPPPPVGSPMILAVKPGSRYDATVVGFMNTWFLPVVFGGLGATFTILGLVALVLGTRGMSGSGDARQGWSGSGKGYGDDSPDTVVNNYYGDDGTYQA